MRRVLQRLIDHRLYAKAEKCEFHQTSTSLLGYIINQRGVAMDEKNIRAVLDWPQPATLKELQPWQSLGFTHFYWRFIRNFSLNLHNENKLFASHMVFRSVEGFYGTQTYSYTINYKMFKRLTYCRNRK